MSIYSGSELRKKRNWTIVLSMIVVGLLAALLYSRAFTFAFFNDDPTGHFAWMETRSLVDFFSGSADYGYYRPIVFTTLKILVSLAGYQPPVFHTLLLILHGANVAMLWLLAKRLSSSSAYAWTAALIFATVPFSYEAVAYVASLTHPLLLFWLLLTVLLYQQARSVEKRQGRSAAWKYDIAAFITFLLGLFSHENGLLIPFVLVGVEWLEHPPRGLDEGIKRPFLPYFGAAALFFLLWLVIPKNNEENLTTPSSIFYNLLPFLQTIIYPILPLASLSSANIGLLIGLALAVIILMYFLAMFAQARGIWLFALVWFGLSTLPAILFLSSDYLYGSPRLHYLPAVGAALFWSLPVLALFHAGVNKTWWPPVRAGLAGLYTLAIIFPPLSFINCELDFYAEAGSIIDQMRNLASTAPADQDLLFINVPFFFSSTAEYPQGCRNVYPWTPVGAVVIPPYATSRDFIRFNGGPDRHSAAAVVPEYAPGWNSHGQEMSLADVRARLGEAAVFVFDLNSSSFFDLTAAWQPGQIQNEKPLATFDERISLVETGAVEQAESNQFLVTLKWQILEKPDAPVAAFVHLYNQAGQLVAQHDGPPAQNFVPFDAWQPGDLISDQHIITLDPALPPGSYTLAAGLYNSFNGERLSAKSGTTLLPNNVIEIGQIDR